MFSSMMSTMDRVLMMAVVVMAAVPTVAVVAQRLIA